MKNAINATAFNERLWRLAYLTFGKVCSTLFLADGDESVTDLGIVRERAVVTGTTFARVRANCSPDQIVNLRKMYSR